MLRPIGARLAFLVSSSIGLGYSVHLFGLDFLMGRSAFWSLPQNFADKMDIQNILAGYWWFVQARRLGHCCGYRKPTLLAV